MRFQFAVFLLLTLAGTATAADLPLANAPLGPAPYYRTEVVSASNGRGFLVVSLEIRDVIALWGMRADEQGRPVDRAMFPISDNSGAVYPAGVASDGDSYLVGYYNTNVSHMGLDLARVDDHGVVTHGGTVPNVMNVSIAWGGSAYVVGYVDTSRATVAAVVASDGTVLRSGIPIVIGAEDFQSFRISPGANGNVIATWNGKDARVHAVVVRTAALIDGTYAAQASGEGAPAISILSPAAGASNGSQTLLVWTEAHYPTQPVGIVSVTIRARRLDAGGNPTGDPIVIAQLYASSSSVDFSVAWNGSVFVVGYAMFSGLHGEVVSVAADDHVTTLGEFSHEQYGSSALIAVAGGNRGALLVWNTDQLNGAFIGTGATPTIGAAQLMAASSAAQKEPSIAWCGDAYRAVWNEQSDRGRIVFGRVSARGVPVDVQGRYVSDSPGFQVMPRIACNASNSLVVWMELLSDVWTTRAALLDSDGTSHPPIDLGPTYSPAVVWNGSEYLVASQSADTHEVMLRRIAQDGQPIDVIPKILRSATDSFGDSSPSIAWNGSEYLIGWVSVNGVFDSLPTRHGIYAVRVTRELTSVGSVHELSPPRSVASNADSASPLAIAGDHEWLVAWKEWPDYARWLDKAAYFARLSPALDPISTGVLNRNAPPSDGTFNGGAYQFVYGLAAIAHGGSVPIVIRGRDTEEFLPRLYVSIESERMRPARR